MTLCLLFCAACGERSPAVSPSEISETATTTTTTVVAPDDAVTTVPWAAAEQDHTPDLTAATVLTLDDSGCRVDGDGAAADGAVVTVTCGGTYVVRGALSDGQLCVDAKGETVTLVLDGVDIHSETSAPLYVRKAEQVILNLAAGTTNRLSDGTAFVFEDAENEEPSAALFSKADLAINGEGALQVDAVFRDGIVSRDGLKIAGGAIAVTAADDAVMGRDHVVVGGGTLTLTADGDGIKSTNDSGADVGFVTVEGGTLAITSGADGIQAQTALSVTGGDVTVTANGGHQNGSATMGNDFGWGWNDDTAASSDSTGKGLKAGTLLAVSGGNITVDAADDALHSNDTLTVSGGVTTAAAGDDGVHADTALTITGGKLTVTTCYEGLEAATITLDDGDVSITASDDGINASSGSTEAMGDRGGMGGDPFAADDSLFTVNGGTLYVDAQGDGLDSNGHMRMNGGTVYVCGPSNGGNGTLDYASTFTIRGGVLIAVGSSGMAQTPSSNTQNAVVWNGCSLNSGSLFAVTDADGNVIAQITSTRTANWAYVTAPTMKTGETYTLSCDGNAQTVTLTDGLNSLGNGGGMGGFGGGMGGPPDGGHGGRPGGWW